MGVDIKLNLINIAIEIFLWFLSFCVVTIHYLDVVRERSKIEPGLAGESMKLLIGLSCWKGFPRRPFKLSVQTSTTLAFQNCVKV